MALIDRDVTKKTLTRLMADHMRNRARMYEIAVSVLDAIDDMPAVDAELARRWKWLVNGIALQCPLCKKSLVVEQADEVLGYCPFCGKPMGGVE